jgi:hypothetical protein
LVDVLLQVVRLLEEVGFQQGTPLGERRVLAFAPEVLPLRLQSEQQVRAALMGLLQVIPISSFTCSCRCSHHI